MKLAEALQVRGDAHNRSAGHINVYRSTVVDRLGPQSGFTVTRHAPMDVSPQQRLYESTNLADIETFLLQLPDSIDMNAWTAQ